MQEELHIFIIWHNAHSLEKQIITDIKQHLEIQKIFNCHWDKETFTLHLARFYKKKLYHIVKKEKQCGNDDFLFIAVKDKTPRYVNNINRNIRDLKDKYRNWSKAIGDGYLVHSSDNSEEAKENLRYITGLSTEEFAEKYPDVWDGKTLTPLRAKPIKMSLKERIIIGFYKTLRHFV